MKSSTWFALLFAAFLFVSNQSQAQVTTFPQSGLDGSINASLWKNNELIVGGSFVWADGTTRLNRIARWDGSAWHAFGDGFNGDVNVVDTLSDGTLIAAGEFTHSGSTVLNRIARWNGQEWLPFGTGFADGEVFSVKEFRGELVAAGVLSGFYNLAKWNGQTWTSIGTGVTNDVVNAMIVFNNDLIVGGVFGNLSNSVYKRIARWDGANWHPMGLGFNQPVTSFVILNDSLIANGRFSLSGFDPATRVVRWTGTGWSTVGTPPSVDFQSLAVHDNTLFGSNGNGIYRLNGTAWNLTWFRPIELGFVGSFASMSSNGGRLAIGGSFFDSSTRMKNLAIWDGSGFTQSPIGEIKSGINATVLALQETTSGMAIGGFFTTVADRLQPMITEFSGSGFDTSIVALNGPVRAMTAWGDTLVAVGSFISVGTIQANLLFHNIALFDGESWSGIGDGLRATANSVTRHQGDIIAGGISFRTADGTLIGNIVRWTGTDWQLMGDGFTGQVFSVYSNGTTLYAGGSFTRSGARTINRIARWDGAAWQSLSGGFNGNVLTLTEFGGSLIAAGEFTQSGSVGMNRIAQWTGSAWQPLGTGLPGIVNVLLADGNVLYAGGAFPGGLAKWTGTTWEIVGSEMDGQVYALALKGRELHIGGSFNTVDGQASSYYAIRLLDPTSVNSSVDERPSRAILHQNYPNPFNPTTMLRFELPSATQVNLELFDMLGRRVAIVISGQNMASGSYDIPLNAESLASGIYLARLSTSDHVSVIKLSVLK